MPYARMDHALQTAQLLQAVPLQFSLETQDYNDFRNGSHPDVSQVGNRWLFRSYPVIESSLPDQKSWLYVVDSPQRPNTSPIPV